MGNSKTNLGAVTGGCMGPSINRERLDEAVNDILILLHTKYHIVTPDKIMWNKDKEQMAQAMATLAKTVEEIFCVNAYNSF